MPNGDKYAGEFHAGKLNGPGTATFASGTKYVGTFKDGKIEGAGTASYLNGDQYKGTFKDGKLDQGALTSPAAAMSMSAASWATSRRPGHADLCRRRLLCRRIPQGRAERPGHADRQGRQQICRPVRGRPLRRRGTLYAADGSVIHAGQWVAGKFVGGEAQKPAAKKNDEELITLGRNALPLHPHQLVHRQHVVV